MSGLGWTDWDAKTTITIPPYQDWWSRIEKEAFTIPSNGFLSDKSDVYQFSNFSFNFANAAKRETPQTRGEITAATGSEFQQPSSIPLAMRMLNRGFENDETRSWMPDKDNLPTIDNDTVIVGVIDSGISFAQNRFRYCNGKTRVLAAWQQNADFAGQTYLPFGKELYQQDINDLIKTHSGGAQNGHLDEDAFNRDAGIVDMQNFTGHREAAGRYSHGTSVLDLAAGYAPQTAPENIRIIVVNLPTHIAFGYSGTFLDYFMYLAMQRIKDLTIAIWNKNNKEENPEGGYPLVINLSYGKQAGSKSDLDWFAAKIKGMKEESAHADVPFEVVMPAGNDNQKRGLAVLDLKSDKPKTLNWHILPEDQTSNYVEIWCTVKGTTPKPGKPVPLAISLRDSNAPQQGLVDGFISLNQDGKAIARVYCSVKSISDQEYRVRYILCTAPTLRHNLDLAVAPSGVWEITLQNKNGAAIQAFCTIQTDQSLLPNSKTGQRSFFDMPDYKRYDSQGRMIDSAAYGDLVTADDGASMVTRKGTINASASLKTVNCIAGYQASNGKPALYSASGFGAVRAPGYIPQPTVALPTDDSAALFGILTAGARNGSRVAMRGTSFAAPQYARILSAKLAHNGSQLQCDFANVKIPEANSVKIGAHRLEIKVSSAVKR